MAWFRRNKVQQNTIPELQEYYNAERRERSGLSWLLALVSVACAGLVIIGLIFGGKWLYRKLANNLDKNKTSTTQTQTQPTNLTAEPAETDTSTPTNSTTGTTAETPATTPATTTPASASTTPAATTPTASTTTAAASSNSALPHTGPAGTLAIFIGTVLSATIVRFALFKRKFLK